MQRRRKPLTGTQKTTTRKFTTIATTTIHHQSRKPRYIHLLEDGFDKELLGLTGGFLDGEKGLRDYIEKNPPPKKSPLSSTTAGFDQAGFDQGLTRKPKAPELSLLMPRIIAIAKI